MNSRQKTLLYVGLISAILILLIACFNYINLNFSRLLQQVRMIHTEKLMGATKNNINHQLFIDTFLTVIVILPVIFADNTRSDPIFIQSLPER